MIVTRLFLRSEQSLLPSKVTAAFLPEKNAESNIRAELKMKGKIETNRLTFKSDITAKEATVIPIANEPVFPTNILPEKLNAAKISQNMRGPTMSR